MSDGAAYTASAAIFVAVGGWAFQLFLKLRDEQNRRHSLLYALDAEINDKVRDHRQTLSILNNGLAQIKSNIIHDPSYVMVHFPKWDYYAPVFTAAKGELATLPKDVVSLIVEFYSLDWDANLYLQDLRSQELRALSPNRRINAVENTRDTIEEVIVSGVIASNAIKEAPAKLRLTNRLLWSPKRTIETHLR